MSKIFVGIVTCNRPAFFLQCFKSIHANVDITVVNDGADFQQSDIENLRKLAPSDNFTYIHNTVNLGVCKSKNILFREFLKSKCKHCFIIEEDIVIKVHDVFKEYIRAQEITGIQHFCFGYHGPANKQGISGGVPSPRYVLDYGKIRIALNSACVGAFCYYTREVIEKIGLMDERLNKNCFEHVLHTYKIIKAGYSTPYWWWADIANSCDYLTEQACSEHNSAIRKSSDWGTNMQKAIEVFKQETGYQPAWNNAVPDTSLEDVINIAKQIQKKYAIRS